MINLPVIIEASEATELWTQLLGMLFYHENVALTSPRGEPTRELLNVTLCLRDARRCAINLPIRKLNYHFMVAEWVWIALGYEDLQSISHYNPAISRFSDDGKTFFGAYGPRWTSQLEYVVRKLREDRDTRQAVCTIWRPNPPGTRDVPCTIAMQYLIRKDRLHAIVTMRSSDAWLGVPYDVFNFSMLANIVAGEVGIPLGEVRIQLGSSHMYERNADAAMAILVHDQVYESPAMPQLPGQWPAKDAGHWWQMAEVGHAAAASSPWHEFLMVLADRARRNPEIVPGPLGELIRARNAA